MRAVVHRGRRGVGANYRRQRRRKTTLLRLLAGLARPDSGGVYWQGEPLHRVRDSYHQNLLWIGHQPGIKNPAFRAGKPALLSSRRQHGAVSGRRWRRPGLAGYEDIPVNQLSAGQQRRVALARLWLTRATLWILDEPFTAIDVNGVERAHRRMAQHVGQGGERHADHPPAVKRCRG
ncbi:ABC transporter involved in cytochrome c biogenesis ATPase component CcmA [Salmonella bongori]|nr:ABC transporter involved in cytochrome c biogenesis ATPase component CcmA [Salmonella bongori]